MNCSPKECPDSLPHLCACFHSLEGTGADAKPSHRTILGPSVRLQSCSDTLWGCSEARAFGSRYTQE